MRLNLFALGLSVLGFYAGLAAQAGDLNVACAKKAAVIQAEYDLAIANQKKSITETQYRLDHQLLRRELMVKKLKKIAKILKNDLKAQQLAKLKTFTQEDLNYLNSLINDSQLKVNFFLAPNACQNINEACLTKHSSDGLSLEMRIPVDHQYYGYGKTYKTYESLSDCHNQMLLDEKNTGKSQACFELPKLSEVFLINEIFGLDLLLANNQKLLKQELTYMSKNDWAITQAAFYDLDGKASPLPQASGYRNFLHNPNEIAASQSSLARKKEKLIESTFANFVAAKYPACVKNSADTLTSFNLTTTKVDNAAKQVCEQIEMLYYAKELHHAEVYATNGTDQLSGPAILQARLNAKASLSAFCLNVLYGESTAKVSSVELSKAVVKSKVELANPKAANFDAHLAK